MEPIVNAILTSMSTVKKPQKLFMLALFSVLTVFQGKATFRNLSRYSEMSEKRLSRWYRRVFDFVTFNGKLLNYALPTDDECIAAIDASFMRKSGKHTQGLGWFYNGCTGKTEQGLELSLLCCVHLKSNTAYALEAQQTMDEKGKSRIDFYAAHVVSHCEQLQKQGIRYLAADAHYSKTKFISAVVESGLHRVGKLRADAQLRWLYAGDYCGRGRPKKFDGQVDFENDVSRFIREGVLINGEEVYSQQVYNPTFKRLIKLVMLRWHTHGKTGKALLFSTDTQLDAMTLVKYYKARFQIEFLFRDAKQYTGLTDCQSRKKEAIHMQINASLSALNILKIEDRLSKQTNEETVISIASWKRIKFNQHLMVRIFDKLGVSKSCQKFADIYRQFSDYGAIAA